MRTVRIYLDDTRPTPEGWMRCYYPEEVIAALQDANLRVIAISLDHDLGDKDNADIEQRRERTGYDVVEWIEESVFNNPDFHVPELTIHSANPMGALRMQRGIESIHRRSNK